MVTLCRASRKTEYWNVPTPMTVGPGSYSISPPRKALDYTAAPFSSMTERPLSARALRHSQDLTETPGPGSYQPSHYSRRSSSNRGSNSFVSAEARMAPNAPGSTGYCFPTSILTPGPGAYNLSKGLARRHPQAREKPRPLVFELSGGPPSIPPQLGFSPEAGNVGPGQYSPTHDFVKTKPTSIDFSHSKDARKLWEPTNSPYNRLPSRSNPGPGSYDSTGPAEQEASGNATFMSRVKRAHQREVEERSPGPGVYEAPSVVMGNSLVGPPFGSNCQRGQSWANDIVLPYTKPERTKFPGVGAYNLDDSIRKEKEGKRKQLLFTSNPPPPRAPFLTDKKRDCLVPLRVDSHPGPGAYNGEKLPDGQTYNLQVEIGNVTFATKQERFKRELFETKEGPDPGQYHRSRERQRARAAAHTFKSKTTRFPDKTESVPPVGYYDIW